MGAINQNLLIMIFLIQIYSQLEQKCQSEPVEDHKKDTFRQAQCDNWYKLAVKNNYTQRVKIIKFNYTQWVKSIKKEPTVAKFLLFNHFTTHHTLPFIL